MKFYVLFLLVLLLIGCNKESPTEQGNQKLNEPFELKIGDSAVLDHGTLNFSFDSVSSDNRCPENSFCYDLGDAAVVIKHSNSFYTFHTNKETKSMTIGIYHIELLSLSPYPKSSDPIPASSYIAKFMVTKSIL